MLFTKSIDWVLMFVVIADAEPPLLSPHFKVLWVMVLMRKDNYVNEGFCLEKQLWGIIWFLWIYSQDGSDHIRSMSVLVHPGHVYPWRSSNRSAGLMQHHDGGLMGLQPFHAASALIPTTNPVRAEGAFRMTGETSSSCFQLSS